MKIARTPEEKRQWHEAAIFLDAVKRDELANMTDEEGWRHIESIQSVGEGWRDLAAICGLIEQQGLFAKLRK